MADPQDRPAPPGGPLRQDQPDADVVPGEPARDPGPEVERVTKDDGGEAPPPVGTDREQDADRRDLQEENAGTSLDQPST